ncbi:GGDEF domain-containing protein [Sphingomonas sp. CFBP 13603]|uniref:GGDEF domain-containing protein n=1 Tax=Sphingomonas sp. CFBP 13603 TaxID=2774040 RepID=UPI001FD190CB|nr:diguanylate cyclase [Sphingomonas sp. CFBP 13603]
MESMAWLRWMIGAFALAFGLALAVPAAAVTGTPISVCVRPAIAGQTPATLFGQPRGFDCTTSQTQFGSGDFWVLSQPLPAIQAADHTVRIGSTWVNRVTLFVLYADGSIRNTGFTSRTAGRLLGLGAVIVQPLPSHDAAPVRLLWHVEGAANLRGLILGPALADHDQRDTTEILLAALYGAFGGMAIALIVYNLALWGALRQAFQPAYCLLVLFLLAYAVTSSGALGQMFPTLDNNDRQRLNTLFLAGSAASALVFARTFFEQGVFGGWLRAASSWVIAALLTAGTLWAAFAPWQFRVLDTILASTYLLLLVLIPIILFRAWRMRSNFLWLFALAWSVPIVVASLRVANAFELLDWSLWLDNSTILSMALESMLSSLAIAYRIRLLSVERDTAREQEIAARLLADTEPLTGLLNRRAFLHHAIGRPGDQMLLIADVDHFKRVNETIGHDGGDEVLRVVARALRNAVPPEALVARIGGEEFAILVDAATPVMPDTILERLRSQRMPFDIAVTASIGSCTGPLLREADWKTLYRSADRALFAAKGAGRDRSRDASVLPIAA